MRACIAIAFLLLPNVGLSQITVLSVRNQKCVNGYCSILTADVTAVNIGPLGNNDYLFVSAGHLRGEQFDGTSFSGMTEQFMSGRVRIGDDMDWHDAQWVRYWTKNGMDISFWKVNCTAPRHRDSLVCFPVWGQEPEVGDRGVFRGIGTGLGRPISMTVSTNSTWMYASGQMAIPGDSGGPLIVDGAVAGILSGTSGQVNRFTPGYRILDQAHRYFPSLRAAVKCRQKEVSVESLPPIPQQSDKLDSILKELKGIDDRLRKIEERPVTIRYMKGDGTPHRTVTVPPNQPIDIDPIPVEIVDKRGEVIQDENGNAVREWFPYGTPIRLQKYIVE